MLLNEANFISEVFDSNIVHFDELALQLFQFQYTHNTVYHNYCNHINRSPVKVQKVADIPFLPTSFFKNHEVKTGIYNAETIYTSSTTTGSIPSKHYVKHDSLYEKSFLKAFHQFYGSPSRYAILALLPSYLERDGSSLISMANTLIEKSGKPESGFYLDNLKELQQTIVELQQKQTPILLLGVTFALLDFAEQFPMDLSNNVIVMETGGMKGRRKELIRSEVHEILMANLNLTQIHSEYGMTELLSQAYAADSGRYHCPPWMKIVLTDPNDPLTILPNNKTGLINIIDLANIHSCAFIQTSDIGKTYDDDSFEVLGRMDQSDVRGCSLMYL